MQCKNNKLIGLIPTRYPSGFTVQLNLEAETRFIGNLEITDEGTFTSTRTKKHLFRKTNSLGMSYALLSDKSISFKWIVLKYCGKNLVTSRDYFLKFGRYFQFSGKGYETQMFLSLELFGLQKAREFEASQTLELFGQVA